LECSGYITLVSDFTLRVCGNCGWYYFCLWPPLACLAVEMRQ